MLQEYERLYQKQFEQYEAHHVQQYLSLEHNRYTSPSTSPSSPSSSPFYSPFSSPSSSSYFSPYFCLCGCYRRVQQKKIARFKIAMAKWKFDYQTHMHDKYEKVFAELQSRYLQEVEGMWRDLFLLLLLLFVIPLPSPIYGGVK